MQKSGLIVFLILSLPAFGQNKDPYAILESVKSKYSVIKDYTVDAGITVNVRMLNIPPKKVTLYYKYPDKMHVESKGFALLPKRAGNFNPGEIIGDKYTAIYAGNEKRGNTTLEIIRTIPNETSDVILTTFWIDSQNRQIRKLEINTKSAGTFQAELEYHFLPYDLPSKLTVVFDVREMNMPKTFTGEVSGTPGNENNGGKKGRVTISYSGYRVNTGLDDKLFREKKK